MLRVAVVVAALVICAVDADDIDWQDGINECTKGAACGALTGYTVQHWGKQMLADSVCSALMDSAGIDFAKNLRSAKDEMEREKGMTAGSQTSPMAQYKPYMPCIQQKFQKMIDLGKDVNHGSVFQETLISCGYKPKDEAKGGWKLFGHDIDRAGLEGGAVNAICGGGAGLVMKRIVAANEKLMAENMAAITNKAAAQATKLAEKRAEMIAAEASERAATRAATRAAEKAAAEAAETAASKAATQAAEKAASKAAAQAAEKAAGKGSWGLMTKLGFSMLTEYPAQSNITEPLSDASRTAVQLADQAAAAQLAKEAAARQAAETAAAKVQEAQQKSLISKAVGFGAVMSLGILCWAASKFGTNCAFRRSEPYLPVDGQGQQWPSNDVAHGQQWHIPGKGHPLQAGLV